MNQKKLIREQLEVSLQRFTPLLAVSPPPKGWIRAIRDALGMTAKQLAHRLGMAQQAVSRIEKEETAGSVTIKTMRRVAEGLDCVFVCGFVPRSSLDSTIRSQARRLALKRLNQAAHTMALEDQALSREENQKMVSDLTDEFIDNLPSGLWDDHE